MRLHLLLPVLLLVVSLVTAALGGEILWGDSIMWGTLDNADTIVWSD